jgi:hypothetical protein
MALQNPGYDISPQAASIPLGIEDVDWLLENGKQLFKDTSKRQQFLIRVKNTLAMYRTAMNDLHREINRLQAEVSAPGASSGALDPLTAARYLSDEQKEQLFTGSMRQAWTALLRLRGDAARLRAQANSDLGAARFALANVLEDPSVSNDLRQRVGRLLSQLPAATAVELAPIDAPLPDTEPAPGWQVTTQTDTSTADPKAAPMAMVSDRVTPAGAPGQAEEPAPAVAAVAPETAAGPDGGGVAGDDDLDQLFS